MTESQAILLFKCLSDATRLQLVKALSDGPKYVELLAELLERTPSTISFHLKKLEEAGLVTMHKEQYYAVATLNRQMLDQHLSQIICPDGQVTDVQAERKRQYREKVLQNLFEYGRLKTIPVQRKKRRIVLEKLAESFESGRTYSEKEVNLIIAEFHDDFCTLRREMIAEGIMQRERNEYWLNDQAQNEEGRDGMNNGYELLVEKEAVWAEMLMEMLKNNNIPCISSPARGAGLVIRAGVQERLKVYVPAAKLQDASDLLQAFFPEENA